MEFKNKTLDFVIQTTQTPSFFDNHPQPDISNILSFLEIIGATYNNHWQKLTTNPKKLFNQVKDITKQLATTQHKHLLSNESFTELFESLCKKTVNNPNFKIEIKLTPMVISNQSPVMPAAYYAHEYDKYIPAKLHYIKTANTTEAVINAVNTKCRVFDGVADPTASTFNKDGTIYQWSNGCGDKCDIYFKHTLNMEDNFNGIDLNSPEINATIFKVWNDSGEIKFTIDNELAQHFFNLTNKQMIEIAKNKINPLLKNKTHKKMK